ncbi:ABC transporter ATP-binding protein [Cryptosporangium arvum]|uniref:ABC-type multidrug transport system, ATPase and permease component n=1 Tax=Cryptosporangium arvum DSM 44712 TaxID=927661 RepID=A0A010YN96_9ACTN|nr:ABC transporter ATP-binding protein [Cryptosporangium arvum]EXG81660.1 ABC-type multidrug transport system, ATPase and permease component [Cryptosporangium arvum DSM 44712]
MAEPGNRVLARAVSRNRRRLAIGTLLVSAHQICETAVPILIGVIVDTAVATGDRGNLAGWIGALAGLFLALTLAYRFGARQLVRSIAEEAHRLRMEVSAKILDPRGITTDLPAGELLTVSTSDADNTAELLDYLPRIAGAVVATVVSAAALLVVSVPLGLLVLVCTPIVLGVLQLVSPRITERVASQQELAGRATSLATDLVSGVRPLRGIGAERAASARYSEVSRRSLAATLRAARTQGAYLAASTTLSTVQACGVAILAGWFALTGRITVGELITVIGLAQFLIEPFGLLALIPSWVASARASAGRVAAVVDAPPLLPAASAPLPAGPCAVELAGLRYGPLELDLLVEPGEVLGVVATQPAEGEALVRLLSGRVAPGEYAGRALLAGHPLHELDSAAARGALLVQPHKSDLFGGTIEANIAAGTTDRDHWDAVLRSSAADEVIGAHPDGLGHVVVERGANLSGGQRQRVALARALLVRSQVLVLHDPTTAMDSVTEHVIAQGIRAQRAGLTTVLVASSPALMAITDRVVMLDGGRIVATGTHTSLGSHDAYRKAVLR